MRRAIDRVGHLLERVGNSVPLRTIFPMYFLFLTCLVLGGAVAGRLWSGWRETAWFATWILVAAIWASMPVREKHAVHAVEPEENQR